MLLKPKIKLKKVTDISIDILNKYGIKGLMLDVDNTLSTHHGQELTNGLMNWIENMKNNGINLILLSNSKEKRVEPFANKIGLNYISLALKPLPFGFFKAKKALGLKHKEVAIVGDQIFTDVLGGNLVGVKTLLLTPIKLETTKGFVFKRKLEKIVYKLHKINDMEN